MSTVDQGNGDNSGNTPPPVPSLEELIESIRARRGDLIPVEEVGSLVRLLLLGNPTVLGEGERRLYGELHELSNFIKAARAEIAALDPGEIREHFLPSATDELDTIVQDTEGATERIMDACDAIEAVASSGISAEAAESLRDITTQIYEACSFQDLTGQRITRVVRVLKAVADRVQSLVNAFDSEHAPMVGAAGEDRSGRETDVANLGRTTTSAVGDSADDMALLHGPQSATDAMKQSAIDALLNPKTP